MISVVTCILECARLTRARDTRVGSLHSLWGSTISGHKVLAAIRQERQATNTPIPHFGFRRHDDREYTEMSNGVNRYFDIVLILDGNWDLMNHLTYWITGNAQISLHGKKGICKRDRQALEPVE